MNMNNKTLLEKYMKNLWNEQTSSPPVELQEEENAKYHPATDITFLERLDADAITDSERVELLEHLDRCVFCRQEMERLCKCGALFGENGQQVEPRRDWMKSLKQQAKWLILLSCCILLFLGIVLLPSGDPARIAHRNVRKTLNEDEKHFSLQLTENGYRLSGTSTVKGTPILDDHKREVRSAYETLVEKHPDNIDIRTEYGKYLLYVIQDTESARSLP